MMLDDVDQLRNQQLQRVAVTRCRQISFNGMKVPHGGIRRVVVRRRRTREDLGGFT